MDTFLNTELVVPEKIDLDELEESLDKVWQDWHNSFIDTFKGVPMRIDETLEGGQYFITVSRELYKRLKIKAELNGR